MPRAKTSRAGSLSRSNEDARPTRASTRAASTSSERSEGGPSSKLAPGLHLVATPIGNVGDLSGRALATLAEADLVLCEDTRVTGRLLQRHGVARRLASYHEHNAARVRPGVIERLRCGERVALASDAGTPLVSDPGYKLVREAIDAGVEIFTVPGPSAAIAALTVSGLPSDRFLVEGFLPATRGTRRRAIAELAHVPATLVIFAAARRLASTLAELAEILGAREAAVARELTKRFEEVRRGPLADLARHYREGGAPRGEVVVVVGPPRRGENVEAVPEEEVRARIDAELDEALRTMPPGAAAAAVAAVTGRPRREVYRRALARRRR